MAILRYDQQAEITSTTLTRDAIYSSINHRSGISEISTHCRLNGIKKTSEEALKSYLVAGPGLEPGTSWL